MASKTFLVALLASVLVGAVHSVSADVEMKQAKMKSKIMRREVIDSMARGSENDVSQMKEATAETLVAAASTMSSEEFSALMKLLNKLADDREANAKAAEDAKKAADAKATWAPGYNVVSEAVQDWDTAAAKCQLAMPRSQAAVKAIVDSTSNTGSIWIGLSCKSSCTNTANWRFADGSRPATDFPWEPNQPNSAGKACAYIRGISSGSPNVNDVPCTSNSYAKQYACEATSTTFAMGSAGSNQCPAGYANILTPNECQAAAIALGLRDYTSQDETHQENHRPKGCFTYPSHGLPDRVFLNPNPFEPDGPDSCEHPGCRPICEKAGDEVNSCQNSDGITGYHFTHNGYWLAGNHQIDQGSQATNKDCARRCIAYSGCVGFAWYEPSKWCNVYTALSTEKALSGMKAYAKCQVAGEPPIPTVPAPAPAPPRQGRRRRSRRRVTGCQIGGIGCQNGL